MAGMLGQAGGKGQSWRSKGLLQLRVPRMGWLQDENVEVGFSKTASLHYGCRYPLDWLFRRSQHDQSYTNDNEESHASQQAFLNLIPRREIEAPPNYNEFSVNGNNPLSLCLSPGVHFNL
jgi:hypothetical protein